MNGNHTSEEVYIDDVRDVVRSKMDQKGLEFKDVAEHIGVDPVFFVSTLFGQQRLPFEAAEKLAALLEIETGLAEYLSTIPIRSTDTFMARLNEMVDLYGEAIKELTYENFGDGILSAVDVKVHFERKGDRAIVTIDSKFLPYSPY
jgi:cyanate lyase